MGLVGEGHIVNHIRHISAIAPAKQNVRFAGAIADPATGFFLSDMVPKILKRMAKAGVDETTIQKTEAFVSRAAKAWESWKV